MANLAIPRENRPFSFCQLANLRASDNSSGTSTIKDDEIVSSTAGGGQSTSTDTATIAEWDRRAKDNYFSALDNSWSSATTTRAGGDAEGNPSLSQSIVEAWENSYRWQLDDYTDNGNEGWSHHQETTTTRESGYNSQTASVSGPEDQRRQTLAIDSAFESLVENEQRDTAYTATPNEPSDWSYSRSGSVTRDEKSNSSHYDSSHLADAAGLARDGSFSYSSTHTETHSGPVPLRDSYNYSEDHDEYNGESYYALVDDKTEQLSRSVKTMSEYGSYYDAPLLFGFAVRIQSGDYEIDEYTLLSQRIDTYSETDNYSPDGLDISDDLILNELTFQGTTTGTYGPGGIVESRDVLTTKSDREYTFDGYYWPDDSWSETIHQTTRNEENDNGKLSGHLITRSAHADSGHLTDADVTTVEDLFEGNPPSGPKSQTTKGGYTPGILEASIAEAAATNLFPGGQQLNALANLLSPIAAAIAALGQVGEETAPIPSGLVDAANTAEIERMMREGVRPPEVVGITQIGSGKGLGSQIYGDDPIVTWNPLTWLGFVDASRRSILNIAFPPVTPSYEFTYDDGTKKTIFNGSPTTEGLAGQAALFAPFVKGGKFAQPKTGTPQVVTPSKFAGMTNAEINQAIGAPQRELLRQWMGTGAGSFLRMDL